VILFNVVIDTWKSRISIVSLSAFSSIARRIRIGEAAEEFPLDMERT